MPGNVRGSVVVFHPMVTVQCGVACGERLLCGDDAGR